MAIIVQDYGSISGAVVGYVFCPNNGATIYFGYDNTFEVKSVAYNSGQTIIDDDNVNARSGVSGSSWACLISPKKNCTVIDYQGNRTTKGSGDTIIMGSYPYSLIFD